MTYGEVKQRALQLLDQYSNGGTLISETDSNSRDYILKFPELCDEAQREIATAAQPIRARAQVSAGTVPNLLDMEAGTRGMAQHLADDVTDAAAAGAKSYYFEADGAGTTYVEEETATGVWTALATVATADGGFAAYRGLISPSDAANSVRFRHSGLYPYQVRNRALYAVTFASAGAVQAFGLDAELTMPADFWRMEKLLRDGLPVDYEPRGRNAVSVARDMADALDVHYFKYPAEIPDSVADSYTFEVSEEAAAAIPHYVASKCMAISPQFAQAAANEMAEYQGRLANLRDAPARRASSVRNVFTAPSGRLTPAGRLRS